MIKLFCHLQRLCRRQAKTARCQLLEFLSEEKSIKKTHIQEKRKYTQNTHTHTHTHNTPAHNTHPHPHTHTHTQHMHTVVVRPTGRRLVLGLPVTRLTVAWGLSWQISSRIWQKPWSNRRPLCCMCKCVRVCVCVCVYVYFD